MANNKPELPFGWVVKQSRSYPDRLYYFNVNTGASTWEFPDLLQHYVNGQGSSGNPPVLSSILLQPLHASADHVSLQKTDLATSNVPPKGKVPQMASGSRKKSSAAQEAKLPPPQDSASKHCNRESSSSTRPVSLGLKKKVPENICKHYKKSSVNEKRLSDLSRKLGLSALGLDKKLPRQCANLVDRGQTDASKNAQNQIFPQKDRKSEHRKINPILTSTEQPEKSLKGTSGSSETVNTTKPNDFSHAKRKDFSDANFRSNEKSNKKKVQGVTAVNRSLNAIRECVNTLASSFTPDSNSKKNETKTGKRGNVNANQTSPTKKLRPTQVEYKAELENVSSLEKAVPSSKNLEKQMNVPLNTCEDSENLLKKLDTDKQVITDKRKVVKSSLSLATNSRHVSLKDKRLLKAPLGIKNDKLSCDFDLTVSTSKEQVTDCSIHDMDDSGITSFSDCTSNTEFKLFIGDKNKLMSIQSWINNLQEDTGSESPSLHIKANFSQVNESIDSGYISPGKVAPAPTKRGWPGELRKPAESSRELVVSEIDECLLPVSSPRENEEESMDIEEMLVEVRQQVCQSINKHEGCFVSGLSQSNTSQREEKCDQMITVVVDTNVLINDLKLLDQLKEQEVPGTKLRPCLFIPWVVLRELDALKETVKPDRPSLSLATQKKAKRGILFLQNLFKINHPGVRGQTARQADMASNNFQAHCNDDVILQACLQCQKSEPCVVLLTNDMNLINKAVVCGVPAFNAKDILSGLQNVADCQLSRPKCHTPSGLQPSAQSAPVSAPVQTPVFLQRPASSGVQNQSPACVLRKQTCLVDRLRKEKSLYTVDSLVEEMYSKMKSVLHEAFGRILEVEMKKAYEDIWTDILYRKPPWSVEDIFQCWRKHWIAVFGFVFSRHLSKNVDILTEHLTSSRKMTLDVVTDMCEQSVEILLQAKNKNAYGPRIPEVVQTVISVGELCESIRNGSMSVSSISSLDQFLVSKVDGQSGSVQQPVIQTPHSNCPLGTAELTPTAVINTPTSVAQNGCVLMSVSSLDTSVAEKGSNAGNQNSQAEQAELIAGKVFSQIWTFIYNYCNEFYKTLSGSPTTDLTNMKPVLKELVSSSLDLRKYYTGLLELPVDDLKNHEEEFTALSYICKTFLSKLNSQEADATITPIHLLVIYSKPEYRATLTQFGGQLDEMLQMMYQCLQKICPDD